MKERHKLKYLTMTSFALPFCDTATWRHFTFVSSLRQCLELIQALVQLANGLRMSVRILELIVVLPQPRLYIEPSASDCQPNNFHQQVPIA
jgi:hypothetical protein